MTKQTYQKHYPPPPEGNHEKLADVLAELRRWAKQEDTETRRMILDMAERIEKDAKATLDAYREVIPKPDGQVEAPVPVWSPDGGLIPPS